MIRRPWPNGAKLSDMAVNARQMTEKWVPALAAVTPGAGCYLSEVMLQSFHMSEVLLTRALGICSRIRAKLTGSSPSMAPTMRHFLISRRNMIRIICSMATLQLGVMSGESKPTAGYATWVANEMLDIRRCVRLCRAVCMSKRSAYRRVVHLFLPLCDTLMTWG